MSGFMNLKVTSGRRKKQINAGTSAAQSQPPHVMSTLKPSLAKVTQSGLAAMPVMKRAPVIGVKWKHVITRKSPIFLPVFPGPEPKTPLMALTTGRIMPPERAVTEGMAGAMMRSAVPNA